jgi:hypothetical protein
VTPRLRVRESLRWPDTFVLVSDSRNRIITTSIIVVSAAVSVSEITTPKRLSITLDPGLVLERLILRRLADLQRKREQDWIRSLLVQGFLAEGRWLRAGEPDGSQSRVPHGPAVPATPFSQWLQGARDNSSSDQEPTPRSADVPTTPPRSNSNTKPFAHLRKVIG